MCQIDPQCFSFIQSTERCSMSLMSQWSELGDDTYIQKKVSEHQHMMRVWKVCEILSYSLSYHLTLDERAIYSITNFSFAIFVLPYSISFQVSSDLYHPAWTAVVHLLFSERLILHFLLTYNVSQGVLIGECVKQLVFEITQSLIQSCHLFIFSNLWEGS